jgi:atypical dual specificity phosphatase
MVAGFRWIIPDELAGSAQPGLLADLDDDLTGLWRLGIRRIVTLTGQPLAPSEVTANFALIHFPILDMGIPTPRECARVCAEIVHGLGERPVLLHCRGGLGRTGTVAACCLVNLGRTAEQALTEVRGINPFYVQTQAQARFIEHYAAYLASS